MRVDPDIASSRLRARLSSQTRQGSDPCRCDRHILIIISPAHANSANDYTVNIHRDSTCHGAELIDRRSKLMGRENVT
jgi:hypothetical protein